MKLLKKFKETDIIEKVYILILVFIVIIAIITIITRYTNQSKNTLETDQKNDEKQQAVELVEKNQNVENNANLAIERDNNAVIEETETSDQYKESEERTRTSTETKKETDTQTSQQPTERVNNTTQTNQKSIEKLEGSTQTESKLTEKQETEQKVQLDFSKYDRYTPALNGGYTCFRKSDSEIAKLKSLIDQAIGTFGYKNVKIIQNKDIAMSTRYFTANRTNVENKVYNSEDFTIYYYAEVEYTLSSQGEENLIQYRSYITVR